VGLDLDGAALAAVSADIALCGVGGRRGVIAESCDAGSVSRALAMTPACAGPVVALACADALSWLAAFRPTGRELVYCDPPYLLSTRRGGAIYAHELGEADHVRLLRVLLGLPCMVMVSGYWSELYASALASWSSLHFSAMTRGGGVADEWVWFNYPPPVSLHDYRFLGDGFRERERIARRVRRWRARLGRMDVLERRALLAAMAEAWRGDLAAGPPR